MVLKVLNFSTITNGFGSNIQAAEAIAYCSAKWSSINNSRYHTESFRQSDLFDLSGRIELVLGMIKSSGQVSDKSIKSITAQDIKDGNLGGIIDRYQLVQFVDVESMPVSQ